MRTLFDPGTHTGLCVICPFEQQDPSCFDRHGGRLLFTE